VKHNDGRQATLNAAAVAKFNARSGHVSGRAIGVSAFPALVLSLSLMLMASFMILILISIVGHSASAVARPDPFVPFRAVWPGQSLVSIANYVQPSPNEPMTCWVADQSLGANSRGIAIQVLYASFDPEDTSFVCTYSLQEGLVSKMSLVIDDERVQKLQLYPEALRADSLLLYWGTPDSVTRVGDGQILYIMWVRDGVRAVAVVDDIRPGAVVRRMTLKVNSPLPTPSDLLFGR
jgi:hypothetical protein